MGEGDRERGCGSSWKLFEKDMYLHFHSLFPIILDYRPRFVGLEAGLKVGCSSKQLDASPFQVSRFFSLPQTHKQHGRLARVLLW